MALTNNVYYNAAFRGFLRGALSGRPISSPTAATYLKLTQAAQAFATEVDSKIAFDALVTTSNVDPTLLVLPDPVTQATQGNATLRAPVLEAICAGVIDGRYSEDAVAADWSTIAAAAAACFAEALLLTVSP